MIAEDLERHTNEMVASILFAWTMLKPELLQTFHRLALLSSPATATISPPPIDTPVTDVDSGISIRPSEMQQYFIESVIPAMLAGLQSMAEEALNDYFGNSLSISSRLRNLHTSKIIDKDLLNEAHFWRLVRNVSAHGNGTVSQATENEASTLLSKGEINFTEFSLWGPLLDAGHGGVPVPLTREAQKPPYTSVGSKKTPILTGNKIEVGLGDVLACGRAWSRVLRATTGGAV